MTPYRVPSSSTTAFATWKHYPERLQPKHICDQVFADMCLKSWDARSEIDWVFPYVIMGSYWYVPAIIAETCAQIGTDSWRVTPGKSASIAVDALIEEFRGAKADGRFEGIEEQP